MATITSLSEAREALTRAHTQLRNLREKGSKEIQRVTVLGTHSAMILAGGASSGALRAKLPLIAEKYPSDGVLGSAICTAALLGLAGDYDDELNCYGSGLIAGYLSREVESLIKARSAAP